MQKEPTTDKITAILEDYINERTKGAEYVEQLETSTIRQFFYLFHTLGYECKKTALEDFIKTTKEIHIKMEEHLDGLVDPYEEEIKKQA